MYGTISVFTYFIAVRIQHGDHTDTNLIQKFTNFITFSDGPVAFIGSAVIFCNRQKIFREISVSAFHSAQTDNAGITLSNLKHGDHSVIMTSSDHSELDKISISLSEFPQCEVYFFISSSYFYFWYISFLILYCILCFICI